MRISDWSSDVCSSDLEIALDLDVRRSGNSWRGEARVLSDAGGLKNSARSRSDLVGYRNLVLVARFDPERIETTVNAGLNGEGRKIGRASCRERVCQYV